MLKLGGEMFGGGKVGIDPDVVENVARQIAEVSRQGIEIAVVIGGGSLMGGRFNLLLSVVGALIIQGMNTGILLSGFPPEMNQVVKAVVVLCVLIVQSPRFVSIIKGIRGHDKT